MFGLLDITFTSSSFESTDMLSVRLRQLRLVAQVIHSVLSIFLYVRIYVHNYS